MRKESRKTGGRYKSFGYRAAAAVMSALMLLTLLEPSAQAYAAPGDRHTVTFIFINKEDEPVPDVSVLLKDDRENEIQPSETDENEVTFEGLYEGSSYEYTIDVGENEYEVPEKGTIEIEDQDMEIPFPLYTEAPECSMTEEEIDASYGSRVEMNVNYTGDEPVYYQWYFGDEELKDETSAVLTIDPVTYEEEGEYFCTVETELSDIVRLSADLRVSPADPEVSVNVRKKGGSRPRADITVTVSHPDNEGAPAPEGRAVFYVDGEREGTEPLSDGRATLSSVPIGTDERHSIYVRYISDDDRYYTDAESNEVIYGKATPEEDTDYIVSEPDPDTGWYNQKNKLTVRPAPAGEFDQIWDGKAWTDKVEISEETAEGKFNIKLKNSRTGEETNTVSFRYQQDLSAPTDVGMSQPSSDKFDRDTGAYEIQFTAEDNTAGVASVVWYDADNQEHTVEKNRQGDFIADLTAEEWKSVRRIEAVDAAGNTQENTEAGNQFIEISYPAADRITDKTGAEISSGQCDADSEYFYRTSQATVSLTASDDIAAAEGFALYKNSSAEEFTAEYDPQTGLYTGTVQLDPEAANTLSVQAEGYVIFSNEYDGAAVSSDYMSCRHILDTEDPVISVAYTPATPDKLTENTTGYRQARRASVSVKETNFNPDELEFTDFSAADVNGAALPEENSLKKEMTKALRKAEWKEKNGTYTAENVLVFDTDAEYDFTLKCMDLAGNSGSYEEDEPFIIDQEAPGGLKITYETEPVSSVMENLSLGFYNPSVTVTLSAEDDISGIDYFSWTYEREDGTSTTLNKDRESGIISCTDENFIYQDGVKKAEASFTLTGNLFKQYRGSISFTVKDKAGNTSEVHDSSGTVKQEDGSTIETENGHVVVVDTIAPVRTVRYPEPQQIRDRQTMELYTGDRAEYANQENTDSVLYYDHTCQDGIQAEVTVTEANFYAEDVKVFVNDSEYAIEDWSSEGDEWTGHIRLSEEGTYTIRITYTDRSGNVMKTYESEQIVLDRTPPEIEKYEFVPESADGTKETSEYIDYLEYGYYFRTDFRVVITASDTVSGMDRIDYRLVPYRNGEQQDELAGTAPVTDGTAEIPVPSGFKGQIYADGFDNAGNSSGEVTPRGFVTDYDAPSVDLADGNSTEYTDEEGNPLFVSDVSITASITDRVSGIREISWSQTSEKTDTEQTITLDNTGYQEGDQLEGGWIVEETDQNLVTKVSRTFVYNSDDNNIVLSVSAADRAGNRTGTVHSRSFTVDKTDPVIHVSFRDDDDTDLYYNADRVADVTVTERNFDADLINTVIENEIGDVPGVSFSRTAVDQYTAVIVFDEGDYTFEMNGTDRGGRGAEVHYSGGNEHLFYVDKTDPVITENFAQFTNPETENSFNEEKTVSISVTEHHFDPELMELRIYAKEAGAAHSAEGMEDTSGSMVSAGQWADEGDVHTLTFEVGAEAVYRIEMTPRDLAGNGSDHRSTEVFEIDRTAPVIEKRNGAYVSPDDTEFLDIYTYDRAKEAAPTLEFSDLNIERLEYSLIVWKADHTRSEAAPDMEPVNVYLDSDTRQEGIIRGKRIKVPDFSGDGVYALEVTAVDTAGNRSELNVSTYARVIEQDVLAFIMDSNVKKQTGLYSFQYEDGTPISMRPDSFKDLKILVMAKAGTDVDLVLRDMNAEEMQANAQVTEDDSIYGFSVYNYILRSDFFRDSFDDDTDTDLHLSVKNDGSRVDLGTIHIDSAAPTCQIPEELSSWHWYFGDERQTVTLTGISELLDEDATRIYDNGEEREFIYSPEDNTLTFTLEKGWHNVGISLSDTAGNINNIQEQTNIHIGYFWLWIILLSCMVPAAVITGAVLIYRWRRRMQ